MTQENKLSDENQKLDKKLLAAIEQKLMSANKVPTFEFEYQGKKYLADDLGSKIHFKEVKKLKFYVGFAAYVNKEVSDVHFFEEPIPESDYAVVGYLSDQYFK